MNSKNGNKERNIEGLGVPVIEVMSYGSPVIGFNVGGPKYTIRDSINGFSVQEKNWKCIGKRIFELLRGEKLSGEFGEKGREIYYEEYTWDGVVAEYKKVIT